MAKTLKKLLPWPPSMLKGNWEKVFQGALTSLGQSSDE